MQTEMTITSKAACEVIGLIQEYLFQGGVGFDADLLESALAALQESDRIVITPED